MDTSSESTTEDTMKDEELSPKVSSVSSSRLNLATSTNNFKKVSTIPRKFSSSLRHKSGVKKQKMIPVNVNQLSTLIKNGDLETFIKASKLFGEEIFEELDQEMQAPLHIASEFGHLGIVRFLVESGVNLSVTDRNGWTPLHCACFGGQIEVVLFLLEARADCLVTTDDCNIPLHYFVRKASHEHPKFNEALALMINASTDLINLPNSQGETCLHHAVLYDRESVVVELLKCQANPDFTNSYGETPLHLAARKGNLSVAKLLLEAGASPVLEADQGFPSQLVEESNSELYQLLSAAEEKAMQGRDIKKVPRKHINSSNYTVRPTEETRRKNSKTFLNKYTGSKFMAKTRSTGPKDLPRRVQQFETLSEPFPQRGFNFPKPGSILQENAPQTRSSSNLRRASVVHRDESLKLSNSDSFSFLEIAATNSNNNNNNSTTNHNGAISSRRRRSARRPSNTTDELLTPQKSSEVLLEPEIIVQNDFLHETIADGFHRETISEKEILVEKQATLPVDQFPLQKQVTVTILREVETPATPEHIRKMSCDFTNTRFLEQQLNLAEARAKQLEMELSMVKGLLKTARKTIRERDKEIYSLKQQVILGPSR